MLGVKHGLPYILNVLSLNNMEQDPFFLNIFAVLMIVFVITILMIIHEIKKIDYDLVNSTATRQKGWFSGRGNVDIFKFFRIYKLYYEHKGLNLILIINILSYAIALIFVFKATFWQ